jgi:hypothetical protein
MNKSLRLVLLMGMMLLTGIVSAQPSNPKNAEKMPPRRPNLEQFIEGKTNFILREMKLPAADSARFAPVYRQLQREKATMMERYMKASRDVRHQMRTDEGRASVPDSALLRVVREEYRQGVEDATLELHYLGRFEQLLSPQQLYDYVRAERKFKHLFMTPPENNKKSGARIEPYKLTPLKSKK